MDWLTHAGFTTGDLDVLVGMSLRLVLASGLGAILGVEREKQARAAGMRTHMLVAIGACLLTVVPLSLGGLDQLGDIVKGVATGVGFLGAGTILKKQKAGTVEGLTTAASIWMTAAIGLAVGAGALGLAIIGTVLAFVTLNTFKSIENNLT